MRCWWYYPGMSARGVWGCSPSEGGGHGSGLVEEVRREEVRSEVYPKKCSLFSGLSVTRGQHCNVNRQEMLSVLGRKVLFQGCNCCHSFLSLIYMTLEVGFQRQMLIPTVFSRKRSLLFLLVQLTEAVAIPPERNTATAAAAVSDFWWTCSKPWPLVHGTGPTAAPSPNQSCQLAALASSAKIFVDPQSDVFL